MKKSKYIIGVDEVGRGPLAGPVGVGVAVVPSDFDWGLLPGVADSKKLSEKNREAIFLAAKELRKEGKLDFAVVMVSAKKIDEIGIVSAIKLAMDRALKKIEIRTQRATLCFTKGGPLCEEDVLVKLDGGLKAPERFVYQETIIKGDQKERVIGLASIVAKVTRDLEMTRRAKLAAYAPYDFAAHKGYGTKAHRAAIAKYGLSDIHRKTYCKNIIIK